MEIKIIYQATSVEEFRALVAEFGHLISPPKAPVKAGGSEGPWAAKFRETFPGNRLRCVGDETPEECAQRKLREAGITTLECGGDGAATLQEGEEY